MAKEQSKSSALWGAIIALALIGLGLSVHLTYLHAKIYTDPDYKSVCNISQTINCESVALSKHSILLGIPVAVWGLLAYILFIGIAFMGLRQPAANTNEDDKQIPNAFHGALLLMGLAGTIGSVYFAYISKYVIGAMCPSCMGTYIVNPLIFIVTLVLLKRDGHKGGDAVSGFFRWLAVNGQTAFIGAFILAIGLVAFPRYWQGVETWKDRDIKTGTDHGHAWIGAAKPRIVIVEYTDYQCPHCKIQHNKLRKVLRKHPKIVRLVHRHFPLDHNCHPKIKRRFHPNACLFARASFCAGKQSKFWQLNDILYRDGKTLERPGLLKAAKTIRLNTDTFKKCLDSEAANDAVAADLRAGMRQGVRGTPYFFVNGKAFDQGSISSTKLNALLEAAKAGKLPIQRSKPAPRRATPRRATPRVAPRKAGPAPRPTRLPTLAPTPTLHHVAPRKAPSIVPPKAITPRNAVPTPRPAAPAPRRVEPRRAAPTPPAAPRKAAPAPRRAEPANAAPRPTAPTSQPAPRK